MIRVESVVQSLFVRDAMAYLMSQGMKYLGSHTTTLRMCTVEKLRVVS